MVNNKLENNLFYNLSKAVERKDPEVEKKIRELLNTSDDESQMRYLEGLLMLLGKNPGELEDPPDIEHDPEEYWEEY
tara:strand:+ start:8574 stop:8804 length:231 start_codon:yes stop_codon:yes gene_type:complete